ncbi:acyltransferase family protein [Rheinheimera sp.]|uniref:acyltransferase family protein n=1 Tax=Rheinheimera sp. TaxID=1869214 RepID=UPI0025EAEFDE|nr:acyltransferase [Rheinheimera sp.]
MKRLAILDYARFIAAVMVVLYHYSFNGISNGKISSVSYIEPVIEFSRYGYLGVELFFMISGYVIFFSANHRAAAHFVVSRAVRLYPAYWFAVILTSTMAAFFGGELMSVQLSQVAWNMTMLHSFIWVPHVDGVYWTLVYEITFYAAIATLLLLGMQKYLKQIFLCWPFIICAATLAHLDSYPYLGGYYCYFSAGAIFALLKHNKTPIVWLSLALAFVLCVEFSTGEAAVVSHNKGFYFSPWVIGAIVCVFFLIFLLQNTPKMQDIVLPYSKLVGALTYPLYLIHAHLGYMLISIFATEENKLIVYFLVFSFVILLSYSIHYLVEEKLKRFWQQGFSRTLGFAINTMAAIMANIFNYVRFQLNSRAEDHR